MCYFISYRIATSSVFCFAKSTFQKKGEGRDKPSPLWKVARALRVTDEVAIF